MQITSCPLEWLKLIRLIASNVSKDGEQPEVSYIPDENVKWCTTLENSLALIQPPNFTS